MNAEKLIFAVMNTTDFLPKEYRKTSNSGSITVQSPSNIALVKYWGKHSEQLPKNVSISFTLSNCHTTTTLHFEPKSDTGFAFDVFLEGVKTPSFYPKIETFFKRVQPYIPLIEEYAFTVETSNSFPHSSGIASSASGMSALAHCLTTLEKSISTEELPDSFWLQKTSFLSRLGSGSACRSIEGPLVVWGAHNTIPESSDLYGTLFPFKVHPIFQNYQDTILLVDRGEKQVSSTVGHNLMHNHPFAEQRFRQANQNLKALSEVLQKGAIDDFIAIVESEALSLHAMMMTSQPYFILIKPNTLSIINHIWAYRKATRSKVCFTLDAGANVHVLYPEREKETVQTFIANTLAQYCQNGHFIDDTVGEGIVLKEVSHS